MSAGKPSGSKTLPAPVDNSVYKWTGQIPPVGRCRSRGSACARGLIGHTPAGSDGPASGASPLGSEVTQFQSHGPTRAAALVVLAAVLVLGCSKKDDAPADAEIRRVVTLTPSATEIVAALGAVDRLVGVDEYSTYPPEVTELPDVGSFLSPSPEAILRLEPDLVIAAAAQPEAVRGLRRQGLRVVVLDIHDLGDVMEGLETVGAALGLEDRARTEVASIKETIAGVRQRARGQGRTALVVIDRDRDGLAGLIAAGPGSYLDELLGVVGVENALAESRAAYPKISAEQILRASPDLIFDTVAGSDPAALEAWSRLGSVPAVSAGRVHALGHPIFQSPSPRAGEALERLEAIVAGAPPR